MSGKPRSAGRKKSASIKSRARSSGDIQVPPNPAILIEADSAVFGHFLAGRFDVLFCGWVVSASPAEEITLYQDGQIVTVAQFGAPEHAAQATLPDGTPARQRIFQFNVPRRQYEADGVYNLTIVVRTAAGDIHHEAFTISVASHEPQPVTLLSGPTRRLPASPMVRPPVVVYVERAVLAEDGILQVQGWAIALTMLLSVQVLVGDEHVFAARVGSVRDDVAEAYPVYPNAGTSGFSLTVPLDEFSRDTVSIRVKASSTLGFSHAVVVPLELPIARATRSDPQTASAPTSVEQPVHMYCDIVTLTADGHLGLSGWAACIDEIAAVYIYLDDVLVGEADRGLQRPDVAQTLTDIPSAGTAGFSFARRVLQTASTEHMVRLLVRSRSGAEKSEDFTVAVDHPARTMPSPDADKPEEFRFNLDNPRVENGAAVAPVTGRMMIEGWILARSGVAAVDVLLDGQRLGEVHYGLARQDVGAAFPSWENAVRSGFAFHCPPRSLRNGTHEIRIAVRSKSGSDFHENFSIEVRKSQDEAEIANIRRRVTRAESDLSQALLMELTGTGTPPRFTLFLRQYGAVEAAPLSRTLNALRLQTYSDWHLIVLAADDAAVAEIAAEMNAFGDEFASRISVISPAVEAWNTRLPTGGTLTGLLCPGDELGADTLMEFALASQMRPDADFIYADETRVSPASQEREPFFKPDFSPDLLLSTNYIGHPWIARAPLLDRLAVTPHDLVQLGEYDLVLRATEIAGYVHHVPKLLCARGPVDLDTPEACAAALRASAQRQGIVADVTPTTVAGTWRFKRKLIATPKVSIIVPTCAAHGYIETCINTLRAMTTYPDYEIIVIDNIPDSEVAWKVWLPQNADKIVDMPLAFNWSRFNNTAVDVGDGDYLLFLNDDIEICQSDWLEALMEHAQRPEVGIVGARLLYPDRKVQHAGMFLGNNGIGRHAFRFAAAEEPGYFGLALTQRNTIAVTGACMLIRRDLFDDLGRFDEAHEIVNNDLDFCLRAHQAGLLTVYTPYATLIHHELASRERLTDVYDLKHFDGNWKTRFAAGDPYFNPNLSRQADDYRMDDEPTESLHPGYPLFRNVDIQRILVVKLDHIGDFVTALPAIRQLRRVFPHAKISVLAGPAAKAIASLEPAIDEFMEFVFFHARSQFGERELTVQDFEQLAARLKPQRFDLAVDLRKHLSTRDVLLHTGARFLAGFDYMGQFPFLDIAVEWDGDKGLQRKRAHVIDDLLALIGAIGRAGASDRLVMSPGIEAVPLEELPEPVRALFAKPVVAVHPGAGNITKQWPREHFSALIDLLIERNDVNVLLIGGPDEVEIAAELLASVLHANAIASMAGQTTLDMLPRLLAACELYIGNDSGPKHIAAAMGMRTIGIHSGVVDPAEWGPIGERAVAVRRNMTCSPCYLAVAADCPRDLACLRGLEVTHVHNLAERLLARPIGKPGPRGLVEVSEIASDAVVS